MVVHHETTSMMTSHAVPQHTAAQHARHTCQGAAIAQITNISISNITDDDIHLENQHTTPFIMIYLFGGLAVGLLVEAILESPLIRRYATFPFTVVLLLIGWSIGALIEMIGKNDAQKTYIYSHFTMANTDPHIIMNIFLPVLIFDSSFHMEAHRVFKAMGQILILASLGLLITTLILATVMYATVNVLQGIQAWTFPVCLLFGAILSATDPVAVVSLLRSLGAPKTIMILTEGESLFNDGTAIIAYNVFIACSYRTLHIGYTDNTELLQEVTLQIFGIVLSPLIGYLAAKMCEHVLINTFNNEVREKGTILVTVYFTYFVCETIQVSGVLSLVVLGVWLNYRKHSISPETSESNNRFWHFFEEWANILTFLLAGIVIAKAMFSSKLGIFEGWGTMVLVYFAMLFARAAAIGLLYPWLSGIGYRLPWRHAVVLWWGGLRGAIALLLGIQFINQKPINMCFHEQIAERFAIYIAGSVALTLVINATSFGYLLNFLELDMIPGHKVKVMDNVVMCLTRAQLSSIEELKKDPFLAEANWDMVVTLTTLEHPYADRRKQTEGLIQMLRGNNTERETDIALEEARLRLLQVEKGSYWKQFESGLLSPEAIMALSDHVERTSERPGQHIDVQLLAETWNLSRVQTWMANMVEMIRNKRHKAKLRQRMFAPKASFPRRLHDLTTSVYFTAAIYVFVLIDAIAFTLLYTSSMSDSKALPALDVTSNIILILATGARVLSQACPCRMRFSLLLDLFYMLIYTICVINTIFELRKVNSTLYMAFETFALLRLLDVDIIMDFLVPAGSNLIKTRIDKTLSLAFERARGFIKGEQDASKIITQMISNTKIAHEMMLKCRRRRTDAIVLSAEIQRHNSEVAVTVKTKQTAQSCLNKMQDVITELLESGVIDVEEYSTLRGHLQERVVTLKRMSEMIEPLGFEQLLKHLHWVGDSAIADRILRVALRKEYKRQQTVFMRGDPPDGIYIVATGLMKVEAGGQVVEFLYPGQYFGEMSVIFEEKRGASVLAEINSIVYFIPGSDAKVIMKQCRRLYQMFVRSYCINKVSDYAPSDSLFQHCSDVALHQYMKNGEVVELQGSNHLTRRHETDILILVRGLLRDTATNNIFPTGEELPVVIPKRIVEMTSALQEKSDEVVLIYIIPLDQQDMKNLEKARMHANGIDNGLDPVMFTLFQNYVPPFSSNPSAFKGTTANSATVSCHSTPSRMKPSTLQRMSSRLSVQPAMPGEVVDDDMGMIIENNHKA